MSESPPNEVDWDFVASQLPADSLAVLQATLAAMKASSAAHPYSGDGSSDDDGFPDEGDSPLTAADLESLKASFLSRGVLTAANASLQPDDDAVAPEPDSDEHLSGQVDPSSAPPPAPGSADYHPPLPASNAIYGQQSYWEGRFAVEDSFDWLVQWSDVESYLVDSMYRLLLNPAATAATRPAVPQVSKLANLRVLVVGCGNSPFSYAMSLAGFRDITSIDYSETVIAAMSAKYPRATYPALKWRVMDMTTLATIPSKSFDVVVDKAAMDVLMVNEGDVWNPNRECVVSSRSMCNAISRVLVDGGLHLQISFAQPHFRRKYLLGIHSDREEEEGGATAAAAPDLEAIGIDAEGRSKEFGWKCDVVTLGSEGDGCLHHFLYVMQKEGEWNE